MSMIYPSEVYDWAKFRTFQHFLELEISQHRYSRMIQKFDRKSVNQYSVLTFQTLWIFWQILRNSRPPIGEKKLRRKGKLFCLSYLISEKISKYLTLKMANPQNCTTLIRAVTQRFDPPHCAPCLSLSNGCQPLSMLWIVSLVNLTLNYEAWIKTSFLLNWNAFSENKRFIKIVL